LATPFPGAPGMSSRTSPGEQPLETLLASLDPSSADLARAAVGWILPEGAALTQLGQVELQEFLWYQLPLKWMAPTSQLHEVAWSLADLFTAAGLERYALLSRAPQTHRLLDAWQDNDHALARRMMKEAIRSSGAAWCRYHDGGGSAPVRSAARKPISSEWTPVSRVSRSQL